MVIGKAALRTTQFPGCLRRPMIRSFRGFLRSTGCLALLTG
jgi:hypothetical protein